MAEAPDPSHLPLDTAPEADARQLDAYRRLGGAERVAIAFRLSALTRDLAASGIRRRHPGYDDEQVRLALLRLLFGDELVQRALPGCELIDP